MVKLNIRRWGTAAIALALAVGAVNAGSSACWAQGPAAGKAEDWKGPADATRFNLGVIQGVGIIDTIGGYAFVGTASAKILDRGFAPDLNNSVHAEIQIGPFFASGVSAWIFGSHLRWDFVKDDHWTFYALGGVGGNNLTIANVSRTALYPRFGAGAIYGIHEKFSVRAELSHELTAVGVMFYL